MACKAGMKGKARAGWRRPASVSGAAQLAETYLAPEPLILTALAQGVADPSRDAERGSECQSRAIGMPPCWNGAQKGMRSTMLRLILRFRRS